MATKRVKVHGTVLGYRVGDEAVVDDTDPDVAAAIEGEHFEIVGTAKKADLEASNEDTGPG